MMSKDDREYRLRAEEFERLADEAASPDAREILLIIAGRWTLLADQEKAASTACSQHPGLHPGLNQ